MSKMKVALIFGGNSSEHDVSKRSAKNYFDGFDKDKYEVIPFLISKQGKFFDPELSMKVLMGEDEDTLATNYEFGEGIGGPIDELLKHEIDLFFPVVHGNLGEDGTLQGLFRMLQKPYVGADLKGHAVSFDKHYTKVLLNAAGVNNTKYVVVYQQDAVKPTWSEIQAKFGDVVFVKAANQGSSVGISRVTNEAEFVDAMKDSFLYDEKVLIEQGVDGSFEVEVGIIGNDEYKLSLIGAHSAPDQGEGDGWFDYNNKFVDNSQMEYQIPAKLTEEQVQKINEMSIKAMKVLGIKGLARMDFLVDSKGEVYLGEPNTLPGFTNMSLFQVLWENTGVKRSELIDMLIQFALDEFKRKQNISYSFKELSEEKLGNFDIDTNAKK